MYLTSLKNTHKINIVIGTIIVFLIAGIIAVFVRHRTFLKNTAPPPPPENSEANLSIKNFRHVATENGINKWTLEASSASLYSAENMARLNDISVVFFMKDNQNLTVKANKGLLNSKTNDMTVSGNIIAETSQYTLTTESLNYMHGSHMIKIDKPVEINGPLMTLNADTMAYNINTGTITCEGNIKGSFSELRKNTQDK